MVESPIVTDLLTNDVLPVCLGVAGRREIRVIHLRGALINVHTARDPDLGQPKPTIESIIGIARAYLTGNRAATLACVLAGIPRFLHDIHHRRGIPIADCDVKVVIPAETHAVDHLDCERVTGARPMIISPCMIRAYRGGKGSESKDQDKHEHQTESTCFVTHYKFSS